MPSAGNVKAKPLIAIFEVPCSCIVQTRTLQITTEVIGSNRAITTEVIGSNKAITTEVMRSNERSNNEVMTEVMGSNERSNGAVFKINGLY